MAVRRVRSLTGWPWLDFSIGSPVSIFLAGLVLASIWIPEISHWYVSPARTTSQVVEAARTVPEQSMLEEVGGMDLAAVRVNRSDTVALAEQVMLGRLSLPGFPATPISLPFASEDLKRGSPTFQLMVASLAPADLLLDAYRITKREEFFIQARDAIVAFARYEDAQWVNDALLWNDHAVSARVPVLIKFWADYRMHPQFDPRIARTVLDLVARSAQLLVKPSFYAWRTSHGVLTDLALLQIVVSFPQLPAADELRAIAVERFRDHLNYWIDEEGVTLLHSAGYHAGSLYHFGLALRLFTLNRLAIPEEWWVRYEKAVAFYSLLRRPDGTLPMLGDTSSVRSDWVPLTGRQRTDGTAEPLRQRPALAPADRFALYPVAGYAVWWDGLSGTGMETAAQTVVTWAYQPALGHKVADEPSVVLWAHGRTWVTNTGYWPYGSLGRDQAESWGASNAPHLSNEPKNSERASRVLSVGHGDQLAFIDIERKGPGDFSTTRQIVRLAHDQIWVVVDSARDSTQQAMSTNWTFYPDLSVTPLSEGARFLVTAPNSSVGMVCSFSGSSGFGAELSVGSANPFAGWVVLDRTPTPASAIVVRQASRNSWSLATFSIADSASVAAGHGARMAQWTDAENWIAAIPTTSGEISLARVGTRLIARYGSFASSAAIDLAAPEAHAAELASIREAIRVASDRYRNFPELISYRLKVTYLLLAILIAQELLLWSIRLRLPRSASCLRLVSWIAWTAGGLWLSQSYFAVLPRMQ